MEVPDKSSDKSIVMPSSAAAQAASGASIATADSAAPLKADRQAAGGEDILLLPCLLMTCLLMLQDTAG